MGAARAERGQKRRQKVLFGLPRFPAPSPRAGSPCWPRTLAEAFALLLPAHKGVASRVSCRLARAILLSANRVIVDDECMVQFK